ncbi:hypothetical protein [Pseudanabaena sp. ABRG5-3]|nr:hypothetical protein [Pseudanabaena sp. ABRG5-3]
MVVLNHLEMLGLVEALTKGENLYKPFKIDMLRNINDSKYLGFIIV